MNSAIDAATQPTKYLSNYEGGLEPFGPGNTTTRRRRRSVIEKEKYFDDYTVGESFRTHGRTVTEADFVLHAGHTGDFFPHHMNAEWCRTQDIGERIAHGTMVLAFAAGMTARAINPVAFTYGYDRVRFVLPVHIGDTLQVEATIVDKRPDGKREGRGFIDEECRVLNQREGTAMVFTHVYSVERKGTDTRG